MPPKTASTATVASQDVDSVITNSPFFDKNWYLANYPSVGLSSLNPAYHYLWIGAHLGYNPGPNFSTLGYLAAHLDVKKADMNPLLHFEKHGRQEGRTVQAHTLSRKAPKQAIAASTAIPCGWHMTQEEAQNIMSGILYSGDTATPPRRLLTEFDAMTARRYVVAAAALYDAECAAVKATVIMPTYNRSAQLEMAMRSVLEQSHHNLELLVIDDGSTDNTRDRLDCFSDDPRVRVFWNDHRGVSAARNTGLENATGDFVFYLDSDNTWTPDYIKLMLTGLRASGTDCAYAAACIVNDTGELLGYRGEPFDWDACLSGNYVDMNVLAHRIELTAECGMFDTDLRRMVDWDLILRYSKGRKVAFFPFIGCLYLEHTNDDKRITTTQPYLYRKVVAEKNRLGLGSGAEAIETMSLSFGIKIPAPFEKRQEWGDFHYAESLAEALTRQGHTARIDFHGDWNNPKARSDDVALILRGLSGYKPRSGQLTLMWNISHPDQVPYAEYDGCDQVLIASRSYAALLTMILERPVYPLLQCTDTARFNLPKNTPLADNNARGIFVGNSRREYREMVRWSVENNIDIEIYGSGWVGLIPDKRITGNNVPNRQLGEKYRTAGFVLNDHWQSMKDFGFVSNRAFDVVASGGRLISDKLHSLDAIFGDVIESVDDEAKFLKVVVKQPIAAARRREAADYVSAHHSFDARAKTIHAAVKRIMVPTTSKWPVEPDFSTSTARRTVGLILQRGKAWWTSSAYIRLIGPLTSDYAHSVAGLDLVALDGPDDPRLKSCDICIVQRVAVSDSNVARDLIEKLRMLNVPLYVDTDDAFFLHDVYRTAEPALRMLMEAAQEIWFSTKELSELYGDLAGKSRIRPNNLDPRLWRDYRNPVNTTFDHELVRFAYMGTATHHADLEMVMPAFKRLAQAYPGKFNLTLVGVTTTPPQADWLNIRNPLPDAGGYPAFARFAARELSFDVGIAPLVSTKFNAAKSDIKFLDYSAMGLLSIVSDGPVYRHCIDAGLAIGCDQSEQAWYDAMAAIIERRSDFAAMRQLASNRLWTERNSLDDPFPLADLLACPTRPRPRGDCGSTPNVQ